MDKLEMATMRAAQAEQLKTNPLFEMAFDQTRAAILETWAELPTSDDENARDLHRMLKCLERVKRCIDIHIDTGKLAKIEIEGRAKRMLNMGGRRG